MADLSVVLQSKRRARVLLLQKLQHALPSLILLGDGLRRMGGESDPGSFALGVAEIVTAALVIGSVGRAIRRGPSAPARGHHAGHAVDWIDVFLGAMLFVEALVHRRETGHLPRPTVLLAVTMLLAGLSHGRLARLARRWRSLRVTSDGISVPRRFLRRFTAGWRDIVTFDVPPSARPGVTAPSGTIRLETRDGRAMTLRVGDIANPDDVLPVIEEARARSDAWREAVRVKEPNTHAHIDQPAHRDSGGGQPAKAD